MWSTDGGWRRRHCPGRLAGLKTTVQAASHTQASQLPLTPAQYVALAPLPHRFLGLTHCPLMQESLREQQLA
jgi:hypothetical protein